MSVYKKSSHTVTAPRDDNSERLKKKACESSYLLLIQ